jgi:DNA-binding MarR family transcriptional regulator
VVFILAFNRLGEQMVKDRDTGLDLGELPDMVGVELRICQILAERAFANTSQLNVSPGLYMILTVVRQNPGLKQKDLARCAKLDRSTMVGIIDQCEQRKWLQRRPFVGDRRAHAIHLTAKGEALLDEMQQNVSALEQGIVDQLGRRKRDQLLKLIKELQAVIEPWGENTTP